MFTALLFLIGIVLIAAVLAFFGINEVFGTVVAANTNLIVFAFAVQVISLLLIVLRLVIIARKYDHLGFKEAFKVSMSGMAISLITPIAKIGGEPLKIYMLKKKYGGSKSTAIIAADTLLELASSLFVVLLVFVIFLKDIPGFLYSSFVAFLIIVGIAIVGLITLMLNKRWMRKLTRFLSRRIGRFAHVRRKDYADMFHKAFLVLVKDKKLVATTFTISLVSKVFEFLRMWLVFAAIGVVLPWHVVPIVWSVILVLYLVPWLPGSLGLVEFFGAGVFVFFGLSTTAAAGGILLDRFISYWFVMILGLFVLTRTGLPKRLRR